ncbi:MAG: metallopeptidase family protein [Actinomycetota bacterium]|nr:metallopeptidase family protein [Actinomycetota bacterium]
MDKEKFEEIILDTLENIPDKFKDKIRNLGIVIEEERIEKSLKNKKGKYTLGLYHGLPCTKRPGKRYNFPDKITIYKKTLEKISRNDSQLERNIRKVVLHELGHYFGLDDKKLRELGY